MLPNFLGKLQRFLWRSSRNLLCVAPITRNMLFPQERLAACFGANDAEYAWSVFRRHFERLREAGFFSAEHVLEVGPGRNLGTSLLWWTYCSSRGDARAVHVECWDVFKNAAPDRPRYWSDLARELIESYPATFEALSAHEADSMLAMLRDVAEDRRNPAIAYQVAPLAEFEASVAARNTGFDLVYSQAAVEHIWRIEEFWETAAHLTQPGGWHSHRIDLSDHGRRDTNYIEMLEWSGLSYWLTMRFVPGAINRWRAGQHQRKLESLRMQTIYAQRELRDRLPVALNSISAEFRNMGEAELKSTALDIVSRKAAPPG